MGDNFKKASSSRVAEGSDVLEEQFKSLQNVGNTLVEIYQTISKKILVNGEIENILNEVKGKIADYNKDVNDILDLYHTQLADSSDTINQNKSEVISILSGN